MSAKQVSTIALQCDAGQCVCLYVSNTVSEMAARTAAARKGWTFTKAMDFCPEHAPNDEANPKAKA